ncbi:MAG: malate dehydrogenase [Pseudomonadota bacterium]
MAHHKICLVGSGQIGGTLALLSRQHNIGEVVLFDAVEGMPAGKALDIAQAAPVLGFDGTIRAADSYQDLAGADVIVVTAGIPRRPGMSRDDLLETNVKVVAEIGGHIKTHSPGAFVIVVTNPLDAMTGVMLEASGLPASHVAGMAGVLDSARFRHFLSQALNLNASDVHAFVLGGHGDTMVPLIRHTTVAGISLATWMKMGRISQQQIDDIIQRTRDGGAEIVSLLKSGSAFYAPAASIYAMVDSYLYDRKRVLPAASLLHGTYGVEGLCVGVPVIIGAGGVEDIIELELDDEERAQFDKSVAAVQTLTDQARAIMGR